MLSLMFKLLDHRDKIHLNLCTGRQGLDEDTATRWLRVGNDL